MGDHVIPEGTLISIQINEFHHGEENWAQPWSFDPDRFLVKDCEEKINLNNPAWMTFGYGPRSCIGKTMSLIEQRIFLLMIVRRYQLTLGANAHFKGDIIPSKGPFVLNQVQDYDLKLKPRLIDSSSNNSCEKIPGFFKI